MSFIGVHYIELKKMEFIMNMLEIQYKRDTWWKLIRIKMCHPQETNNRSLLPKDASLFFAFLVKLPCIAKKDCAVLERTEQLTG